MVAPPPLATMAERVVGRGHGGPGKGGVGGIASAGYVDRVMGCWWAHGNGGRGRGGYGGAVAPGYGSRVGPCR